MRWCDVMKNDFSWKSLLKMPSSLLSFCLNATYGTLPSPSNLKRWQIITKASCSLCQKKVCTLAHILGACQVALQQQRFTYRYDSVLMLLVSVLSQFLSSFVPSQDSSTKIIFVKEGQTPKNIKKKPNTGLLHSAPNGSCCMTAMVLQLFHPFWQSRHFVLILFSMLVVSRLS